MFGRRRPAREYAVAYRGHNVPGTFPAGAVVGTWLELENAGTRTWRRDALEGGAVDLVVRWDGEVAATHALPVAAVAPGERSTVHFALHVPAAPGRHVLTLELVEQGVAFFRDHGAAPFELPVLAQPGVSAASEALYEHARSTSPWHYQPARGILRSADGSTFPLFAARASGCHLWDVEGRRFVDYVMGWGAALLGYNEPRVRDAIVAAMDCAPIVPLAHPLEIEVARMLAEDVPCAEMVVFGKNGSDACTVAARVARVYTGRPVILFCGYHGWQDWWVEPAGFSATGIPERDRPLVHGFRLNDLDAFTGLLDAHRSEVAAVMLEPSGPAERPGGFAAVDPGFLSAVAAMTRDAGALLIFDEIMTGFRYPTGSVQRATGVVPDGACLGKALAAGMPLSAFVGRADVLQRTMGRIHYGPTYKGEVYSLAAARAALAIYRREPVAEHVRRHGEQLRREVDAACAETGIAARLVGPPFRMGIVFEAPDAGERGLIRALYCQELLKGGILTYDGVMLPSYAHDDAALKETVAAVRQALAVVARARAERALDRYLEIPPG
jgi:glutamate-1-semialdehyde 2,1-aminomutase